MSWLRGVITKDEADPVTVYERTLQDYADDILNAQRLIAAREQELADAKDQLRDTQIAFVQRCEAIGLPIYMEPSDKPTKRYVLED